MRLPLVSATLLFVVGPLFAQDTAEDRIKEKLQAIQSMLSEEDGTIAVLEKHLEEALLKDEQANADRIKEEINSSKERQQRLTDLNSQLNLLLSSIRQEAAGPIVRRNIPESGQKRQPEARRLLRANPETRGLKPEVAGAGPESRFAVPATDPQPITRIERLRRSLQELNAAGELELARQIEQLIKREERLIAEQQRLVREEARKKFEREAKVRRGGRVQAEGDIRASGAATREKPAVQTEDDSQLVVELKGVIDEMRKEIKELREEIKRLKDDQQPQ